MPPNSNYGAPIVDSPSWWGSVARGIATPTQKAIGGLGSDAPRGKRCAAISVRAFAGATGTVTAIGAILAAKGCSEFMPGPTARAGVPLSLVKGPSASAQAVEPSSPLAAGSYRSDHPALVVPSHRLCYYQLGKGGYVDPKDRARADCPG